MTKEKTKEKAKYIILNKNGEPKGSPFLYLIINYFNKLANYNF